MVGVVLITEVVFTRVCSVCIGCYRTRARSISGLLLVKAWAIFAERLVSIVIAGSCLCVTVSALSNVTVRIIYIYAHIFLRHSRGNRWAS